MSCTGEMRCPGTSGSATYTSSNPCTFERKLCVTCDESSSGVVTVTVSGNGLPNHCFFSTVNTATEMDVSWSATWNSNVSGTMNYTAEDFNTSAKTDELLCDLQRTASSNMNSASNYVLNSDRRMLQPGQGPPPNGGGNGPPSGGGGGQPLNTAAGITLTGGYIYNALSGGNVDAVEFEG